VRVVLVVDLGRGEYPAMQQLTRSGVESLPPYVRAHQECKSGNKLLCHANAVQWTSYVTVKVEMNNEENQ
jgi:hypothetical protein